jgi:transcriptional regulator with XRE-family HTH domain
MGFRENLKSELSFNDMSVKELARLSGVSKRAIDNYTRTTGAAIPSADAAVQIARTLSVTVEYLITGEESDVHHDIRLINRKLRGLTVKERKFVAAMIETIIDQREIS